MSFGNNIKTEKFNSDRIQLIKLNLENHAKTGNPRWYEIQVDGLKAVSKTTDVSLFDDYEMYLSDATEALRVHLFQGTSHKYDGFVFLCNTDAREQHTSLQGVGLSVEEKVAQALREKDFENAKATIEALKLELEEAKEYAEILEDKLEELEQKKPSNLENLLHFITAYGGDFIKRNPKVLAKIPVVGEALAGDMESSLAHENLALQQQLEQYKYTLNQIGLPQEPQSTFQEKE